MYGDLATFEIENLQIDESIKILHRAESHEEVLITLFDLVKYEDTVDFNGKFLL